MQVHQILFLSVLTNLRIQFLVIRFKNDCDENVCEKLKEQKDDIQFFENFD